MGEILSGIVILKSIKMKKFLIVLLLSAGIAGTGQAQSLLNNLKKKVTGSSGSSLSSDDIVNG